MDSEGIGSATETLNLPAGSVVFDAAEPPKRKRGRPKGRKTRQKAEAPTDPLESPAPPPAEAPADPLTESESWFSAAADAARCARAEREAGAWLNPARTAVQFAEALARNVVLREAAATLSAADAQARLDRVPMLCDVAMTPEGAKQRVTCEDAVAQALAITAAYFAPPLLEHPLAQATLLLGSAAAVYTRALRAAVAVAP